jgi:hypothetical protein
MSWSGGSVTAPCTLPYTTSSVEVSVSDSAGVDIVSQRFPATYNFAIQ